MKEFVMKNMEELQELYEKAHTETIGEGKKLLSGFRDKHNLNDRQTLEAYKLVVDINRVWE